jgi:hypothetical protein
MASGGDHGKHPSGAPPPATMTVSCRPVEQGRMPPPTGPRHRPGGVLLYIGDCLCFASCHGTDLRLLICVGLLLLQTRWPRQRWSLSCRSCSLPERGSFIAGKVLSPHGRMDWRPSSAPWEGCVQNVITWAEAVRYDYLAKTCAFMASYRCPFNFNCILEERRILLFL